MSQWLQGSIAGKAGQLLVAALGYPRLHPALYSDHRTPEQMLVASSSSELPRQRNTEIIVTETELIVVQPHLLKSLSVTNQQVQILYHRPSLLLTA